MSLNPRTGGKKKKKKKNAPESGPEWYREMMESDFDGVPKDSSVLHSFGNHISHTIWETGKVFSLTILVLLISVEIRF